MMIFSWNLVEGQDWRKRKALEELIMGGEGPRYDVEAVCPLSSWNA